MDFEEAADHNEPVGVGLRKIQALMDEVDTLDDHMEDLKELLDSAQKRYNKIRREDLPRLLSELQTEKWTNEKGTTVKIDDFVAGGLPKEPDKLLKAIKWLADNGAEALIKTNITVEFSKSQHNMALAIVDDLRKQGLDPLVESGVHAGTLQKHVKERLKRGDKVDFETLGVFAGRIAKITHKRRKPGEDDVI